MKLLYFLWALVERFGANAVSFAGNIVLAYLLSPDDFGLLAMLGVFTAVIFALIDCGMGDALLMHKSPSRRDFNTVFYFNVGVGVAIAVTYAALSPVVARYLGHAELQPVMVALGCGAVLTALNIAPMTQLRSQLRFKRIALINVGAVTLALFLAVGVALSGGRYWALVALQVGFPLFTGALLLVFGHWQWRWEFDVARFKELWRFGVNLLVSTVVTQVSQNIFALVLGKYYNATQAGYLGQAQKLQQTPSQSLESSISITSYVLIAKIDNPLERRAAILRMFGVMTFVNMVFCFLLLAVSEPLIACLLPAKWLPVVPYFRLMLCWGLVSPVCSHLMIIFKLHDRTAVIRNVLIVEKTAIIVAAFALQSHGVVAMVGAATALSTVSYLLYVHAAAHLMGCGAWAFHRIMLGNVALGAALGAAAWAVTLATGNAWLQLSLGTATFAVLSLAACRLLRPDYYHYLRNHFTPSIPES